MFTQSEISLRNSDSWFEFQQVILLFIWDYYVIINWLIWYHKEEPSDLQNNNIICTKYRITCNFWLQLEILY